MSAEDFMETMRKRMDELTPKKEDKTVIAIKVIAKWIGVIAMVSVLGLGIAFPIKWCWNYFMPAVFSLPAITWGQAWCLNFLFTCLWGAKSGR